MDIAKLKARQMVAEGWYVFAEEMKEKLSLGFSSAWEEVRALTGLDLHGGDSSDLDILPSETGISIRCREQGKPAVLFVVTGLQVVASISVLRTEISASGREDRPWRIIVHGWSEFENTGVAFDFSQPCVAMCVGGSSAWWNLWWRGPEDNTRLAKAVVDALQSRTQPSDFVLGNLVKRRLHALWRAIASSQVGVNLLSRKFPRTIGAR